MLEDFNAKGYLKFEHKKKLTIAIELPEIIRKEE